MTDKTDYFTNQNEYFCLDLLDGLIDMSFDEYDFTVDEKRFLLSYRDKANNIRDNTFNGILHHLYFNVVYNKVDSIDIVLKLIKELKLDLWTMFKKKFPLNGCDFSTGSLGGNHEAFIKITEAGASNRTTIVEHQYDWSYFNLFFDDDEDYDTWGQNWDDMSGNPLNFRAIQLLDLYRRFTYLDKSELPEMAVRVLWSSIPDPLLTKTDIFRIFKGISPRYYQKINDVWQWYCNLVNYEETSDKRPRSLKHLSRCIIRNRLRDNIKLPEGVEELGVPKQVQKYLLLKDFYTID
ncbi:uncharacterized protein [Parasteatoda tepidariorum]|uniref:uncharacterized protein n=1 Tax=Parasteatoda tepidariorum TaxID=114398 RepID=UPI00077FE086|nr:uncharacterized protein LOC107457245 [Parasteatoda tepidariorum]